MPDNPHAAANPVFALPEHRIVTLEGRDATAFAQAQLMNDVASLAPGHWQWNGWLTPKGRLIALFALLKRDAETVWLVTLDADPVDLAARLRRFVFRSKVAIAVRADLHVSGSFSSPRYARAARFEDVDDGAAELDLGADGGPRTLRIGVQAALADPACTTQWDAFDLRHGLPRLPASQAERWTPQQLSLERLQAYSIKKGCYPGQEIVARTHFLGQAKRGLALFDADAPIAVGSEVRDGDRALGTVVSGSAEPPLALAVLPLERGGEDVALHAGGVPLRDRPLLDGLAR